MFAQFPDGACLPVCSVLAMPGQLEWFASPCICTAAATREAPALDAAGQRVGEGAGEPSTEEEGGETEEHDGRRRRSRARP